MDYKYRSDFNQVLSLKEKNNEDFFKEQVREQFYMHERLTIQQSLNEQQEMKQLMISINNKMNNL